MRVFLYFLGNYFRRVPPQRKGGLVLSLEIGYFCPIGLASPLIHRESQDQDNGVWHSTGETPGSGVVRFDAEGLGALASSGRPIF